MEIPVDLLVTSTTDDLVHSARHKRHHRKSTDDGGELDDKELNQLASHLPDLILNMNLSATPPFVRQLSGVIMFLDISGFTDLSEKCSANGVAGSDQLTAILNDYMGAMIEEVLKIKGDVLKFAGDAMLALWKINDYEHLLKLVKSVIECSCNIQTKYGTYNAEGLTTLRVKIALSLGRMYFFVFGKNNRYFYCESGTAVKDAKDAEHLCKSGDIIVSPYMWSYCEEKDYSFSMLEDGKHAKINGLAKHETEKAAAVPADGSGDAANHDEEEEEEAVTAKGQVYRKAAFETGIHLNESLSRYVTDIVLDKLEAGQGVEYHSEIRPCTIAFINLLLISEELKASLQCDILQKAYEVIEVELEIYKASLNKVVMFDKGCSFLIIFGLPGKKDSYDCKHAVQCAYKIREKLAELHEVKVSSAGVTTGQTFCGVIGHEYRHEYTVIGKMVNMAARLMTYYPGMVSCDNETYSHSRLRPYHFKDVPVKELKGLTDVGVIREYTEDSTHISFLATSLSRVKKPIIAREREIEIYHDTLEAMITHKQRVEMITVQPSDDTVQPSDDTVQPTDDTVESESRPPGSTISVGQVERNDSDNVVDLPVVKNLLLYEGASESGTTRLLSEIASMAEKVEDLVITDFTFTSNDIYRSYLGIRTILSSLLNLPYSEGKAEERLESLTELLLLEYDSAEVQGIVKCVEDILILTSHIEEARAEAMAFTDADDNEIVLQVLESIFNLALEQKMKPYVLIIDDVEYMDGISWKFIQLLSGRDDVLVVMSMMNYEKATPVDYIDEFLALPSLLRCRIESLPPDVLAIVACQMIGVSAIPVELEQLLMEKTQGQPGYIRHIITDLLTSHDLQIVSLLQYQTDYDDYTWPDFELIAGHPTVVSRKRSMLRTKNKWAFHSQLPETRDPAEDRICIISPRSMFSAATYKTPSSLKGQLLIEIDQLTPSEQLVLKCASVIGIVCSTQILHVLWPFPTATLNTALETLFSKDFLRCYAATQQLSGREMHNNCICEDSVDSSTCKIITFANHLMRDTVYSILVEDLRSEMHYKVAKYLEASVSHLEEDTAEELRCQELPFLADDISYIFADCKSMTAPEDRRDLSLPSNKPNLYTYVRLSSSVPDYVASQDGGFCSQKLLDWLMEQDAPAQVPGHKTENKQGGSLATDDLLNKANGELYHNKGKKNRSRSLSRSVKSRAKKLKSMISKRSKVSDEKNNSKASLNSVALGSSSRRSRANSIRQGRKRTKTQSIVPAEGSRRRNASIDSSFSEGARGSGKFSIAVMQALGKKDQEMDLLASKRESLTAVDYVRRPIIGKAEVNIDSKFALFRQTLWHWRSSLHLKNTLFTLVEAGCLALQHRFLYSAYMYLKFAHIITNKIKQKINPLTGEPLSDQTPLLEEFWASHSLKLVTLLALIHSCVGEYTEASALHISSLEELKFKIPDGLVGIVAEKLKRNLSLFFQSSRNCLPESLQKSVRPIDQSSQMETCRILSSLYHSHSKAKSASIIQLLLDTSLNISQRMENDFEVIICYGNLIHHYQQQAKFSAVHRTLSKVTAVEQELKLDEVDRAKKGLIRLAQFYLHLTILHTSLCEGDTDRVLEAVKSLESVEKEVPDDGLLKLYIVPDMHQTMLAQQSKLKERGSLIQSLQTVDDSAYFTCVWEEFIAAGFIESDVVTGDMKEEMLSYTQEILDYRLENIPDHEVTPLDTDVYEHNILASYVLYMLIRKEFNSPLEMQNSIILLEALQPKELTTYWKTHVYTKVVMSAVLALEQTKNPDSLVDLTTKIIEDMPQPPMDKLHHILKCCQAPPVDPDSGWHAKEQEMKTNQLYTLLDVNMGGLMVDVFEEEGVPGIQRLCRSEIHNKYLYDGGRTRTITHSDYSNWRRTIGAEEGTNGFIDLRAVDYTKDRLIRFKDHEACWKLEERGVIGETILHLCYHNNTPIHIEISKVLLQLYPSLALDIIEREEYYGQTALHLAIVNGDFDSVKLLIASGANVNQPATGRFFLPEDQKEKKKNNSDFVGYAYYGEYPLAFAACFGHESIYDYLLRHGADPNLQDSCGNTVLHMVVIKNQLDMYSYAVRHHVKPANTWIKNGPPGSKDGLTPLALASKLGRQKIFNEIMELHRIELWRFSNVGCSLYPLSAVDSIGIDGSTNWNSALMIIVNGESDDHLEMIQGGVIRQLLDEKWKTFIRKHFFLRLFLLLMHLLLLTSAVCLRPSSHDLVHYNSSADGIRFACEICVVLACIGNFLIHIEEFKSIGLYLFIVNLKNAPSKAIFLTSCFLIICCTPVRIAHIITEYSPSSTSNISEYLISTFKSPTNETHALQLMEETMLIIAVPCAWCMMLFFAKGHSLTGISVMMFYKILIGDIVRFIIIYSVFLIGFSQTFYLLYRDAHPYEGSNPPAFSTFGQTVMSLIHMTFGEFVYQHFDLTRLSPLTKLVFAIFMIVMPVLLLNMLIAMMGNTYQDITAKSEKEWIRQWAKIVLVLERAFTKESLSKFQKQYSVEVDKPAKVDSEALNVVDDAEVTYRGLMVIKQSSKTAAKQRKNAIVNWKWMLRETRRRIKEKKRSGFIGEINFRQIFPDDNEMPVYEGSIRNKITSLSLKKRQSVVFGDYDPGLTAAVKQLAWERDLNLTAGASTGSRTVKQSSQLAPLDHVDSPPTSTPPTIPATLPTGSTPEYVQLSTQKKFLVQIEYVDDKDIDDLIKHAEEKSHGDIIESGGNS